MLKNLVKIYPAFKGAANDLAGNDPLRMAGATAFFTTFALPPVIIIIVRAFGLFFDKRFIGRQIIRNVSNVIGKEGGMQVFSVIKSVRSYQLNWIATTLIFIFLLFVATTLFKIVRGSINQLWNIRVTRKRSFRSIVVSRLKAVGIILFTGVLFMAVMAVDMMHAYMGPYLYDISPQLGLYVHGLLNHIISLVVITIWFFVLFRFLPDGRAHGTSVLTGAFVTGLLFSVGKYIMRWMLSGRIQELYGTSGAMVLILLFVFYSSLILYFGAAFTKVWAGLCGNDIEPLPHASLYHISKRDSTPLVAAEY